MLTMRRIDVCVVAAVVIITATIAFLLIFTQGAPAAAFVSGLALLFGIFVLASFSSSRYGRREPGDT